MCRDKKKELRLGGEDNVLSTNLGTIWKLLRPFWCPHPSSSLNEEVTGRLRHTPDKLIKNLEPRSCLDLASGGGEHSCDGPSCVRIQFFQREDLATWFGDITEKEKSEVPIVAECYASATVNLATALGFLSRMCSL